MNVQVKKVKLVFNLINLSFRYLIKKYLYTINHKKLGLNYFYFVFITGLSGSLLATAIRLEMAYPGSPFFQGDSLRYLQVITAHALIMIFFVVVPIFFGGFANYLLPYHVGSKDVAYPRLNSMGFWIQPCGYVLIAKIGFIQSEYWTNNINTSLYNKMFDINNLRNNYLIDEVTNNLKKNIIFYETSTETDKLKSIFDKRLTPFSSTEFWKLLFWEDILIFPKTWWFLTNNSNNIKNRRRYIVRCSNATQTVAGWTFITPFSSDIEFTGVGVQDMLILGVYYAGISTTISLTNLLITRRTLTVAGMRTRRILLPFISITILLMLRALAIITPILGSAMLMLLLDRHWETSFFDFAYGGDPIFFHHLFWFFGHPEVYVLIIPAFGIVNSVLPSLNFRRIASKHHLVWAIYIMNYMGFLVWGHHMYLIGLDHRSRSLYSTVTIMISMPATIKVVNWTFTLINGALRVNLILFATISFILFFLVAGLTGMWLSHVSLDISMHDSMYVVAHFHLMLSGAVLMGIFIGFYFYFPAFFHIKYPKIFSNHHIIYYTGGQWTTFLPLFWVAFSGLPRRLHDFPSIFTGWQSMSTVGHLITMIGVLSFYSVFFEAHFEKKLIICIISLVPRLAKRICYYLLKLIVIKIITLQTAIIPNIKSRRSLILAL